MKFNLKRGFCQVIIVKHPNSPGMYRIIRGNEWLPVGYVLSMETINKYFTPVDGEALELVDPDRNERLCPPII